MKRLEELKKWIDESYDPNTGVEARIPSSVLIADAEKAIAFASEYWASTPARPGLEAAGFGISRALIAELEKLKDALVYLQDEYARRVNIDLDKQRHIKEAQELLFDFESFLEWYVASSDDINVTKTIRQIEDTFEDLSVDAPETLAHVLFDYASLTKAILTPIGSVGNISMADVDRAYALVDRLVKSETKRIPLSGETKEVAELRHRCAAVLQARLDRLRKAAMFVFRRHPDIVKEVMSSYHLKDSAAAYRAEQINRAFYRRLQMEVPLRFLPRA